MKSGQTIIFPCVASGNSYMAPLRFIKEITVIAMSSNVIFNT